MVTYISSQNAQKYRVLFDKATAALGLSDEEAITSLNEYFAYLQQLVNISDEDDTNRAFVRLPLDEDFFEIDANSRTIKIPSNSFGRYGVGVQGDELAEVVYFTIDRYFDAMDLANPDMNIIIQWETRDANRQTVAGISRNFGKEIVTIDGKSKIVFGWPISSELTNTAGAIKFAVRFYSLGEPDETQTRKLVYSLSTLPSEVTINSTLSYDLLNHGINEIDHGDIITSRITSRGIYDPNSEVPQKPVFTVPLFVMSPEGNERVKIVDLPADENSMIKLAVCARPADGEASTIGYEWQKFAYNPVAGTYEANPTSITSGKTEFIFVDPEVVEELNPDREYYEVSFDSEDRVVKAILVENSNISRTGEPAHFYDGSIQVDLYEKFSTAQVNSVGEYAVNPTARIGVNTVPLEMNKADRIRIPGPLKPIINLPEETAQISVTPEDKGVHAIVNDGSVTLTAPAIPGETGLAADVVGEDPQVTLTYSWKKVSSDGVVSDVTAVPATMPVVALPAAQLPTDEEWLENASENGALGAKGIFNQEHVSVMQNGNIITIYPDAELKFYNSTDSVQGAEPHQWIALDIDTGKSSLAGTTWQDSYTFTAEDENELGVADGHILFWFKADEVVPALRKIDDITLTFRVSYEAPSNAIYSPVGNQLNIMGLPEEGLDNSYFCEVTAKRNKETTTEASGNYRVTNTPKKPVLSYGGEPVDTTIHTIQKKARTGAYRTLSFNMENLALSDNVIYLWMHAVIDDEADYDAVTGQIKAQVDVDGAFDGLLEQTAFPGTRDSIVDADVAEYTNDGGIRFKTSSGSRDYQLSEEDEGIYYCIVINELNNNKAASVGPFFSVV